MSAERGVPFALRESGRIERLGASVRWTSAPGQGSEMRLRLPATLLM